MDSFKIAPFMKWITLKRFCEISGYTAKAIYNKKDRGIWLKNIHWRIAPDKKIFINPQAIDSWICGEEKDA